MKLPRDTRRRSAARMGKRKDQAIRSRSIELTEYMVWSAAARVPAAEREGNASDAICPL